MAGDKIKGREIYESDGSLEGLRDLLKELVTGMGNLRTEIAKNKEEAKKLSAAVTQGSSATKEQNEETKEQNRLARQLATKQAQLNQAHSEGARAVELVNQKLREANRQRKNEIRAARSAAGSYDRLSAEYGLMKQRLNAMSDAQRKGTATGRELEKQSQATYRQMDQLQRETGKYQLNVGNYASAIQGLSQGMKRAFKLGASTALDSGSSIEKSVRGIAEVASYTGNVIKATLGPLLATAIVAGLTAAFSKAVAAAAEFGRTISVLEQVSGATEVEIAKLEKNALQLGSSTQFTAKEVAKLSLEYSKLGFGPAEILKLTTDALNTATVAQSDLAETAKTSGATIRQFNLQAKDSGRVSDVMAKSFASSALDLQKFQVAMATVGPVANSLDNSLELTTARIGVLTSAGLDASTAGTGLRNVLLDMTAKGLTFDEAMQKIRGSLNPAKTAMELFGKRGATVATVLASNETAIAALNNKLEDAAGFAGEAAAAIESDLQGSLNNATSAIEGASIAFGQVLAPAAAGIVDIFTQFVRILTVGIEGLKQLPKFIKANKTELTLLIIALASMNATLIAQRTATLASITATAAKAVVEKGAAVATALMRNAQIALNAAMYANPIGLVVGALILLGVGIKKAYEESETFRAGIDGLTNVFLELIEIAKEVGRSLAEGFAALKEGRYLDAAKSFGQAIVDGNPTTIALKHGQKLGEAFTKGYTDSVDLTAKKRTQSFRDAEAEFAAKKSAESGSEVVTAAALGLDTSTLGGAESPKEKAAREKQEKRAQKAESDRLSALKKQRDERLASFRENQKLQEREVILAGANAKRQSELKIEAKRQELETIRLLNQRYASDLEGIDTRDLELQIREDQAALVAQIQADGQAEIDTRRAIATKALADQQRLALARFQVEERTQAELTKFKLLQELERIKEAIRINQEFGGELTETDIAVMRARMDAINNEIDNLNNSGGDGGFSLAKLLGIGGDDGDNFDKAMAEAFRQAKAALDQFVAARKEAADQNLAIADREVAAAQNALEAQRLARERGEASDERGAQLQFDKARARQKKALDDQRAAAVAQQRIQAAQQAANMITASTKIISTLGIPLAIPALAIMWGTFASAQIRARKLASQKFRQGGAFELGGGGSHATGNHVDLGPIAPGGKTALAESSELVNITSKAAARKYGTRNLLALFDSINKGSFGLPAENEPDALERITGRPSGISPGLTRATRRTADTLESINRNTRRTADNTQDSEGVDADGNNYTIRAGTRTVWID